MSNQITGIDMLQLNSDRLSGSTGIFNAIKLLCHAMVLEVCMRPTYGKDPLYGLLLTFGAAMVLEESIRARGLFGKKSILEA